MNRKIYYEIVIVWRKKAAIIKIYNEWSDNDQYNKFWEKDYKPPLCLGNFSTCEWFFRNAHGQLQSKLRLLS